MERAWAIGADMVMVDAILAAVLVVTAQMQLNKGLLQLRATQTAGGNDDRSLCSRAAG